MPIEVVTRALGARTLEQRFVRAGAPLTFGEVIEGLRCDPELRVAARRAIVEAPFAALFWEVAPITLDRLAHPFEQVLLDAPSLASVGPDVEAFADHFTDDDVVAFDNLGRDARLIVPAPRAEPRAYAHLAACVRGAPATQVDALFERTGAELEARLARGAPVWVSTSGLGVYWVHVRLDARPKYYTHTPYRAAP